MLGSADLLHSAVQRSLQGATARATEGALTVLAALVRGGERTQAGWFAPHASEALLGLLPPLALHTLAHVREAALLLVAVLARAVPLQLRAYECVLAPRRSCCPRPF